jgi:hypothetical protein
MIRPSSTFALLVEWGVLTAATAGCAARAGPPTFARDRATIANQIRAIESELARAVVARDVATFQRTEAESYVHTDSDAKVS